MVPNARHPFVPWKNPKDEGDVEGITDIMISRVDS